MNFKAQFLTAACSQVHFDSASPKEQAPPPTALVHSGGPAGLQTTLQAVVGEQSHYAIDPVLQNRV